MNNTTTCVICGKTFEYHYGGGIPRNTCSPECQCERIRRTQREANNKRREEINAHARERWAERQKQKKAHKPTLENALKECREQGISYAERQIQSTWKMLKENTNENT